MERRTVLRGGITVAGAAWAAPAIVGRTIAAAEGSALRVFFDDFSQESDPGGAFTQGYNSFQHWTVGPGIIDLVGSTWQEGTVELTGTQRVDLDGTGNGGATVTMELSSPLNLAAGSYRLRARVEGNNRVDSGDTVVLRVDGITPSSAVAFPVPGRADYQDYDVLFTVGAGGAAVTIGIDHPSADDSRGPILDSVEVSQLA